MFEALNPLYWWGVSAVSAPIIIHLINRLRYRRVRWAAMEFLLKSQQRNRRKLIIEQLLLLLTRCALVLLAVLLVVRPLWLLGQDSARAAELPSYHLIVIDDTLSTQDVEDPQGRETQTAFREGVRRVLDLAQKTTESSAAHHFTVLKLSDPKNPEFGRPLGQLQGDPPGLQVTDREIRDLRNKLEALEPTYLRLHPLAALKEAREYLATVKEGNKYLHFISDFRRRDWTETDADEAARVLAELAHPRGGNVQVRLHDVAHPRRPESKQEVPRGHPNLGLVNLQADSRVVTPGVRVRLTASLKNFGDIERTGVRLAVKVDGNEKNEFSRVVERISGGEQKDDLYFDLTFSSEEKIGLKRIAISIDDKDHLPADNVRYTYVELRKEIPVLLVDPDHIQTTSSDSAYVTWAFNERTNLKTERLRPNEVKNRKDLDQFSVIFLLNVPGVGTGSFDLDPEGLKALEGYAARGGSVVFFLGPRVNVASYNEHLYKNGQGLFPARLTLRPDPAKIDGFVDDAPDPEDLHPKVRFLKADHPVFRIYKDRSDFLYFLTINRYFKVDPNWQPPENVTIVAQLANRRPLENYRQQAVDIVRQLNQDSGRYGAVIRDHARKVAEAIADAAQKRARKGPLLEAVGGVLDDPALADYWKDASPARQEFKRRVSDFHQVLTTGDPLILEASVGKAKIKGRVMAILTSAGPTPIRGKDYEWNNWASLMDPNQFVPYVVVLGELHRYMAAFSRSANETEVNRLVGGDVEVRLDRERYEPRLELWHYREGTDAPAKLADLTGQESGAELTARIHALRGPGFYLLRLNQPTAEGGVPKGEPEERPLAFNVDAREEGALSRVAEAELHDKLALGLQKGDLKLSTLESQEFVQSRPMWFVTTAQLTAEAELGRNKSWSDYAWVLLLFIVLLLLEQWLAMKLSYHIHGGALPLPAARPAAA